MMMITNKLPKKLPIKENKHKKAKYMNLRSDVTDFVFLLQP